MSGHKLPSRNGYYWVNHDLDDKSCEQWQMAYLDCEGVEAGEITLTTFCPEIAREAGIKKPITVWRYHPTELYHRWIDSSNGFNGSWSGPEIWIGPICIPGVVFTALKGGEA